MSRSYFFILLRRSLGFWIGLRLLLTVALLAIPMRAIASPGTSLCMVVLTVWLLLFDARAAGEDVLLANFGVSRMQVALSAMLLPAAGEMLVLAATFIMGL